MMKKEILVITAVILALVFYLSGYEKDRTNYELPSISHSKKVDISGMVIKTKADELKFIKKNDKWFSHPDNYTLDADKISRMTGYIETLRLTELVSERKNYDRYDLGKDKGVHVEVLKNDKNSFGFVLGKTAPSNNHTFIKIDGDSNIYLAAGNMGPAFADLDDLRDKTVLTFDGRNIRALKISRDQKNTQLKGEPRADDKAQGFLVWKDSAGEVVDSSSVDEVVTLLSDLKCKSFLPDSEAKMQKQELMEIILTGKRKYSLTMFRHPADNEGKSFVFKTSMSESFFLLEESLIKRLKESCDEILPLSGKS